MASPGCDDTSGSWGDGLRVEGSNSRRRHVEGHTLEKAGGGAVYKYSTSRFTQNGSAECEQKRTEMIHITSRWSF